LGSRHGILGLDTGCRASRIVVVDLIGAGLFSSQNSLKLTEYENTLSYSHFFFGLLWLAQAVNSYL
jgi:hypothetical protein